MLCPILACSPPPPWSIPLLGPTADFLFQKLLLWLLLPIRYSLRLRLVPRLDWGILGDKAEVCFRILEPGTPKTLIRQSK